MKNLIAIIIILSMVACDDIFENDISNNKIEVVAPTDHAVVAQPKVTFLWRTMDGATAYHLTVVSPSFDNASIVVADTILRADSLRTPAQYNCSLTNGNYQWSIRALNSAYSTKIRYIHLP